MTPGRHPGNAPGAPKRTVVQAAVQARPGTRAVAETTPTGGLPDRFAAVQGGTIGPAVAGGIDPASHPRPGLARCRIDDGISRGHGCPAADPCVAGYRRALVRRSR